MEVQHPALVDGADQEPNGLQLLSRCSVCFFVFLLFLKCLSMFTWAPSLALGSDTGRMLNRPRGPARLSSTGAFLLLFFFFRDTLPPPRLANGREDKLHLNDVIISDAASCNQGRGAGSGIRREVLHAWVGRQAEPGCGAFICLLSPSVLREKRKPRRKKRKGGRRDTKGSKR